MAKLQELKEKALAQKAKLQEQIQGKLDKIAFVKKWTEPRAANPYALSTLYKEGNIRTRVQVVFVYLFAFASILASSYAVILIMKKSGRGTQETETKISSSLGSLNQKILEKATILSLGKLTLNTVMPSKENPGSAKEAYMTVDLWIRVDTPDAAAYAQSHESVLIDKALEAFQKVYNEKVNLLEEEGKSVAKQAILSTMNSSMKKGKVVEVFFHNLVVEAPPESR